MDGGIAYNFVIIIKKWSKLIIVMKHNLKRPHCYHNRSIMHIALTRSVLSILIILPFFIRNHDQLLWSGRKTVEKTVENSKDFRNCESKSFDFFGNPWNV